MIVGQPWDRFTRGVALDIAAHILLDFRKRGKKGGMMITVVRNELLVCHVSLASQQNGHLDHVGSPWVPNEYNYRPLPLRAYLACALLCLFAFTGTCSAQKKGQPAAPENKVGLVTRDVTPAKPRNWRGAEDHTLHVTVWYPAADTAIETPQTIGPAGAPLFEAGSATPHAAFAPSLQPFPLILLSHGTGGSAAQMAWLGTALARAGFIAAAVDHPGNNAVTGYTAAGFLLWWERAADLSDVLDGLLADPELSPHIDRGLVGAAGFSLGGYTVLEIAGARTDIAAFYDLCKAKPDTDVCHVPEMRDLLRDADGHPRSFEQLLATVRRTNGESLARSDETYRDPRIKAVFALAPALGFTLTPESLRALRLPVGIVAGGADTIAPPASSADFIRANVRGARESTLPGVGHYDFLDTCTATGKTSAPQYCTDPPGLDRNAVHAQAAALAIGFFARAFRLK